MSQKLIDIVLPAAVMIGVSSKVDYQVLNSTSGLRSKSGSKGQHDLANRLRTLLVDLSTEALRDMNIGRDQRAKRLLNVLSKVGILC